MVVDAFEVDWCVFALHGRGVETVGTVDELHDVAGGVTHRRVILRAQVLQALYKTHYEYCFRFYRR